MSRPTAPAARPTRSRSEVLGPGANAHDLVAQQHPALAGIGRHLGTAIGSLVNIFGPERVAIGGGFGVAAGSLLIPAARPSVIAEALAPSGEELEIVLASLGAQAGLIGAGLDRVRRARAS